MKVKADSYGEYTCFWIGQIVVSTSYPTDNGWTAECYITIFAKEVLCSTKEEANSKAKGMAELVLQNLLWSDDEDND